MKSDLSDEMCVNIGVLYVLKLLLVQLQLLFLEMKMDLQFNFIEIIVQLIEQEVLNLVMEGLVNSSYRCMFSSYRWMYSWLGLDWYSCTTSSYVSMEQQ